ncbi:MAG: 16S rRNA (adenine(1518)-N(6)/adenine(1519)-N(6))-dimethyltransferase RsmA [Bacteroidales bacterium]|jgi:16S rRNA (adenine1518-N6/adenine1519-N6)-dimethyltransferase|nr:16S rRNA (adenine(1518)-N(6)/adenine(1519)-N(6))-dimethyltransferase RsmA [Bacteroidales bacterium]MDD3300602.1 16S rRNA (adenine(1518)-N(6)/adenine(1519)-N(6))-dimethyltransferase RsmA [Bacteroidales bacterium]MDD3843648.1 16S rRNA (adenine(1518)-N(6)/adenine(1519)-N(6))-dimethyltransferase RsmA [Bacteroidales bacterium]MDD4618644.1 16S rRNA (adenine(1518)-N(6)/adenine(1519)-N(6))-dimethyltransferase RsmA [Bacteroidales bacterium]
MYVKAKKELGQHFLKDQEIAARIVQALMEKAKENGIGSVLEVGPGTGVLTSFLVKEPGISLKLAEIDNESVRYLRIYYPSLGDSLIEGDFLRMDLSGFFPGQFAVIGNFPYNISSQIFFKVLEYRERVPLVVGMLQKEVAERLASPPGNKHYGILSVLLQAWYDIEYLFTVGENSFIPPPKVKSAVIRLKANNRKDLGCDQVLFKKVVKATFNQRRKTIRNSMKSLLSSMDATGKAYEIVKESNSNLLSLRPEQLSVDQFAELTNLIASSVGSDS